MINNDLWAEFDNSEETEPRLNQPNSNILGHTIATPILGVENISEQETPSKLYLGFLFKRFRLKETDVVQDGRDTGKKVQVEELISTSEKEQISSQPEPTHLTERSPTSANKSKLLDLWVDEDANGEPTQPLLVQEQANSLWVHQSGATSEPPTVRASLVETESTATLAATSFDLWLSEDELTPNAKNEVKAIADVLPPTDVVVIDFPLQEANTNDWLLSFDLIPSIEGLNQVEEISEISSTFDYDSDFATSVVEYELNLVEHYDEPSSAELELSLETILEDIKREADRRAQALRLAVRPIPRESHLPHHKTNADAYYDDLLSQYFYSIQKIKLLTPTQERELAIRKDAGDKEAVQLLIEANLRLVVWKAYSYIKSAEWLDLADLIQEGNLGLIRAVDKYDYQKGYKFSTYAVWWIRQAISRAIADKDRLIRLPVHINEKLGRVRKISNELSHQLGREPKAEELAEVLHMPVENTAQLIGWTVKPLSLNQPLDNDDDARTRPGYMSRTEAAYALGASPMEMEQLMNVADETGEIGFIRLIELTQDVGQDDLDEDTNQVILQEVVKKALETLNKREREIIELRFGLDAKDGGQLRTLEEVGQLIGVTRERIRQIEAKVFRKLRHPRTGRQLRDFLNCTISDVKVRLPNLGIEYDKNVKMVKASEIAQHRKAISSVGQVKESSVQPETHSTEFSSTAETRGDLLGENQVAKTNNLTLSTDQSVPKQTQVLEPVLSRLLKPNPLLTKATADPQEWLAAWQRFQAETTPLRMQNLTLWERFDKADGQVKQEGKLDAKMKRNKEAKLYQQWKNRQIK